MGNAFSDLSKHELINVASLLCALLIFSLLLNFWSLCYIFCQLKPRKNIYKKRSKNQSIELTEFKNSNSRLLDTNNKIQNQLVDVKSEIKAIKEGQRIQLDI